ncbi:hypothetical protein [Caldivirga maquilingensis]|uniref:Uncharacterized protein n=1 Tax=Caldivirga maquilingensis (strain ATCC 700844 / DSM 13496 / JCM 10307 / IC-167) TaxID=397948 RepID=A8MDZ8_CALMQ|nr:hypothetical protein [Caldivirga maquilingensis]ABW02004.1 hypothetical protein Cmaq_1177 [Caldivirga maquilingensis IC-167]
MKIELLVSEGEVTVVTEGGKTMFRSIDDALAYIKSMINNSECVRNSWYIRVPLMRILNLLAYASDKGLRNVKEALLSYLKANGLSESNVRVIEPTLQALGLVNNGVLTEDAIRIGELFRRGLLTECARLMMKMAYGNCVLRSMLINYKPGNPESLKAIGLRRRDELNYTIQLLDFMISGGLIGCVDSVNEFLHSKCSRPVCECCGNYLTYYILSRLLSFKLFDYLDLPRLGYSPVISNEGIFLMHPNGEDKVPVVSRIIEFNQANYTPGLREIVDSIEQELRRSNVSRAVLIIPFTVNYGDCSIGKVYVSTYLRGVFTYAKIYDPHELTGESTIN